MLPLLFISNKRPNRKGNASNGKYEKHLFRPNSNTCHHSSNPSIAMKICQCYYSFFFFSSFAHILTSFVKFKLVCWCLQHLGLVDAGGNLIQITILVVGNNDTDGLQIGIDDHRTDKGHASLLQILRNGIRQRVCGFVSFTEGDTVGEGS